MTKSRKLKEGDVCMVVEKASYRRLGDLVIISGADWNNHEFIECIGYCTHHKQEDTVLVPTSRLEYIGRFK